ncbi:hypothetical protein [Mesorhizobium sp. CN2-181]|uniref:hypothetical protein n=1 Tax=Mesorhizobium yinganensis TaxID=3157707 RepID=UPI0032B7D086
MFSNERHILLDRGLTDAAGARHRHARLAPVDGRAEEAIASLAGRPVSGPQKDRVLTGTLAGLGGYDTVTPDLAAALSRSDRDRLFLELRATLFGERIQLTTRCLNPACRAEADIDLTLSELVPPAPPEPLPETVEVVLPGGTVRLRPVIGADDPEAEEIWPTLVTEGDWAALGPADRQRAALALAEADPGPALGFAVGCPECHLPIPIEIDPLELLARELQMGAHRLLAEVHSLAFHYGWSEAEILALPRNRRWRYLELISAQLTGGALTDGWR